MTCQATKPVWQKSAEFLFPLGVVRCTLAERHEGDHEGECPQVKGPTYRWKRGKQASAAFLVRPKG